MSARFSKGRIAPEKTTASTETALPPAKAGKHPVKVLSGAFAAAIGKTPQPAQAGSGIPSSGAVRKPVSDTADKPRVKSSKPGAPILPRQGHR